eukprot:gene8319-9664_t
MQLDAAAQGAALSVIDCDKDRRRRPHAFEEHRRACAAKVKLLGNYVAMMRRPDAA